MAHRTRSVFASIMLVAIGVLASAGPALACSTYGRTFDDVVATSSLIVEADVVSVSSDGSIRLRAREVFAGSMPAGGLVATESVPQDDSCSGRVNLQPGEHVVLGFMDPSTALEPMTVVWWVEPDGTIERTSIVEDTDTTTIAAVRAALRSRLPDTSTTASVDAPPPGAPGWWPALPLALVFVVTFAIRLSPRNIALPRSA